MGLLLLPDRLVGRPATVFSNWAVDTPYIISDTIEKSEGAASMEMLSDSIRTLRAWQNVRCKPNKDYTLSYRISTREVSGGGAYCEVYAGEHFKNYGPWLLGDNPWQQKEFNFKTSADDTMLTVYARLQDAKGYVFFDDIQLKPSGGDTNLLKNGGFELVDSGYRYDNARRHWTDAHGPERIITKAPQSYIESLQRMEKHTLLYGWEDRVEIGCHGYHHSPSVFEPDPKWEFQYFDPFGDSLRLECIFSEYYKMGLTKASLRFWRSPGFAYTKSLLDVLVDKGFVFFDALNPGGAQFGAFMLQRGDRRMWSVENAWWADYEAQSANPTDRLFSIVTHGHLGVIGGHPEGVYADYGDSSSKAYHRFTGILSALKDSCPTLGFVFPDEYADNADAIYKLRIESVERSGSGVTLRFRGNSKAGNTVVYQGKCRKVSFNNNPIAFQEIRGVTYATLPADSSGSGSVVFESGW
jgi:hypothetical protein